MEVSIVSKIIAGLMAPLLIVMGMKLTLESQQDFTAADNALKAAAEQAVEVKDISEQDPALDGKVLFLQGEAASEATLEDKPFGVSRTCIQFKRKVEYYQWVEREHRETKKDHHDRDYTVKSYTYQKEWCTELVDSSFFHRKGHDNGAPALKTKTSETTARLVKLGAYRLNAEEIKRLKPWNTVSLADYSIPKDLQERAAVKDDALYITTRGKKPDTSLPDIGDVRVSWHYVGNNIPVGIMALNKGGQLVPIPAAEEGQPETDLLLQGRFEDVEHFIHSEKKYRNQENVLRFLILVLMVGGGLRWVLIIVADCRFMENIVTTGLTLYSFYLGTQITLFLNFLVWIQHDDLVGVALLLLMFPLRVLYKRWQRRRLNELAEADDYELDFNPADYMPPREKYEVRGTNYEV